MAGKKRKPPRKPTDSRPSASRGGPVGLRIIGGRFRGRKLLYSGDRRTRPMKDRVREAIFNLVGPSIRGTHALDLFAGTGALGLESLSRGAVRATLVEQHFPSADLIRKNAAVLDAGQAAEVIAADVFIWVKTRPELSEMPWVIFCSPPYDFYVDRLPQMHELLDALMEAAPPGSLTVVEADKRLDFAQLPHGETFDIRTYPPAVVGIRR